MWSGELILTLPLGMLRSFHLKYMRKLSGAPPHQLPDGNLKEVLSNLYDNDLDHVHNL